MVDRGVAGMDKLELLPCRPLHHLPDADQFSGVGRINDQSGRGRLDQDIEHTAVGDIDDQLPNAGYVDRPYRGA